MKSMKMDLSKDEVEYLLYVVTVAHKRMIFPEEIKKELGKPLMQRLLEVSNSIDKE